MADLEEEEKLIESAFAEHRQSTLDKIKLSDVHAALAEAQHRRRLRYGLVVLALFIVGIGLVVLIGVLG
jgi:hypothetical protein